MKNYRIILILFFWATFFLDSQAQRSWRIEGKSLLELRQGRNPLLSLPEVFVPFSNGAYLAPFIQSLPRRNSDMQGLEPSLPKAYRYKDLAFFCRIEVQMEQAFKFPVKFRLGEVQYVERMEGKY